jgi:hypothetical protein
MGADMTAQTPIDDFLSKNGDLFTKHFPASGDDQAMVLKAQLIFEALLTDFCMRCLPSPKYLAQTNPSFHLISQLARAMFVLPDPKIDFVWTVIQKVNKLRNVMAHELEPDLVEINSQRQTIFDIINANTVGPAFQNLSDALSYLAGMLQAMLTVSLASRPGSFQKEAR